MQEIELKFLVPKSRLKGLMRQAHVKSSQVTQLAAHYYDTPDQQLAQAGIGLRIRKEGDAWVQTIKAGGDGIAARLEHNTILDNEQVNAMLDSNELMPDLTLYKDTTIASALAEFKLKKLAKQLTRLYVTDVQRTTRLLIEDGGGETDNCLELAYDHGEIIHGVDDTQRDAIQEIEFELVSGDIDFLFTTAKTWCKRYKLCLSTVTKAERGGLLINGQNHSPAVGADLSQLQVNKGSSMPDFVRAAVHNCLLQILPNSSTIVAGSEDDEHISQLYDGIHRLSAALQAFGRFSDEISPEWLPILQQTACSLNNYRQIAHIASYVEPELQACGAPTVDWITDIEAIKITPIDAICANDFQLTLLELIAFTMSDACIEPQANESAFDKLAKILATYYKKCLTADGVMDEASHTEDSDCVEADDIDVDVNDETSENSLYDHLINLRYISEFCEPLFTKKKTKKQAKHWSKHLKKAHKSLEQRYRYQQYQHFYDLKSETNSDALYGAGWFAAMLDDDCKESEKRLAKFKSCSIFW